MKRITRDVRPNDLRHLLEHAPHAYLAFTAQGAVDAVRVPFRHDAQRYYVGVAPALEPHLRPDMPVALELDAGWYFYELRCVRIRGTLRPAAVPDEGAAALAWFEVVPRTIVAWDYGTMRETDADASD